MADANSDGASRLCNNKLFHCDDVTGIKLDFTNADHHQGITINNGYIDGGGLSALISGTNSSTTRWNVEISVNPTEEDAGSNPPDLQQAYLDGVVMLEETWLGLQEFFQKSLVPSSLESRLSGAGAGLQDND